MSDCCNVEIVKTNCKIVAVRKMSWGDSTSYFIFLQIGLALGFPDHELDIYNVNVTSTELALYHDKVPVRYRVSVTTCRCYKVPEFWYRLSLCELPVRAPHNHRNYSIMKSLHYE